MESAAKTRQAQYRLPLWVYEYIEDRARQRRQTMTQVVVDAVAFLREAELAGLMEQGYREERTEDAEIAERAVGAAHEVVGEW